MTSKSFWTLLLVGALALPAQAQVIISEIMYNPNSNESSSAPVEWLEIYNAGASAVDISGWYINDNDGGDGATSAFPAGTMIAAGEAIVLTPGTVSDFQAAWGTGFQVLQLAGWNFGDTGGVFGGSINGLSNSPSATNEILELTDANNVVVDVVNYDDASPWPSDSPDGPSIALNLNALDATSNDDGANWSRSVVGVNGGISNTVTAIFGGADIGSPGFVTAPVVMTTRLQILHASDLEGGVDAIVDAPNFAAVVEALEADAAAQSVRSILLSAGDNYIPGPFFSAAGDASLRPFFASFLGNPNAREGVGRIDITIMNELGFDASAVGNHEFDAGTGIFFEIVGTDIRNGFTQARWLGAQFPYLSSNLDFSGDPSLAGLFTSAILPNTAFRSELSNLVAGASAPKFAPATTITRDGVTFGIVGVTTPLVESISSTGGVSVLNPGAGTNDMALLAQIVQPTIDALRNSGIDKIILVTHLQQISLEQQLAPLLDGVDVIIAGGSDTLLADGTDVLRVGDVAQGNYPLLTTDLLGNPVAIVSTDGQYSYVGRLVIDFDASGNIVPASVVAAESGVYATDAAGVAAVNPAPFGPGSKSERVQQLTAAVTGIVTAKDGNIFGRSSVFLEGRRTAVRTEETNMGNITADANLFAAQLIDPSVQVSHKNGGGIRAEIGSIDGLTGALGPTLANPVTGKQAGEISQLDIENCLRFNNALTLLTLTRAQLKAVLEHAVRATNPGATPGQFGQFGGISFSYDPSRLAGDRVRFAALTDANAASPVIVADGQIVGERPVRIVTLNFLADGGDSYPFPSFTAANPSFANRVDLANGSFTGAATFVQDGTEQDALAEYLAALYAVTPFADADTTIDQDNRIQALNARAEGVLSFVNPAFQIDVFQDVTNCGPLNINVVGAAPTNILLNLVSVIPSFGAGPLFGIGADAFDQIFLPQGFAPFNVTADANGLYDFNANTPCTLPLTVEVVSVELSPLSGFVGVSAPTPATTVSLGF